MLSKIKALVATVVLLAGLVGLTGHAAAQDVVLYENALPTGLDVFHSDGGRPVRFISDKTIVVTRVGQVAKFDTAATIKFIVQRLDDGVWTTISESTPQSQGVSTTYAMRESVSLPPVTLEAGKTYAAGIISQHPFTLVSDNTGPMPNYDGITVLGAWVYSGYATLDEGSGSSFPYTLKLVGYVPAPVPTLSEWALILLGLSLAAGTGIWLQRRRLA